MLMKVKITYGNSSIAAYVNDLYTGRPLKISNERAGVAESTKYIPKFMVNRTYQYSYLTLTQPPFNI